MTTACSTEISKALCYKLVTPQVGIFCFSFTSQKIEHPHEKNSLQRCQPRQTQKDTLAMDIETRHYANMPIQYTAIIHGCKNDNFQMKNCDIFLIFAQKIDWENS